MNSEYATAWADIVDGLKSWPVWGRLGWQEIKRRYRRTVLGPFWTTLSIGMFIGGWALVGAELFHSDVRSYVAFISAGFVSWNFTVALVNEGCNTYVAGEALIKQLSFPYAVLNFMIVWRNIIVLFHNLLIVVLVGALMSIPVGWNTLLFFPGVLIISLNGIWLTMLLGMVSTRFRDIPQLVANLTQILMFVTPVFWFTHQLGQTGQRLTDVNFMFHLLNVIRAPMLGEAPALLSYEVTIGGAVIGFLVTFAIYARFRSRIPYWL